MKNLLFSATFVATFLGLGASAALAQQQGGIAIIDMSYIFKEHRGFKAMTATMKTEVEAAEADLKARKNDIQNRAKQLDGEEIKKGSPDYKALEEELTKAQADLQADVALKKKEFLDKESKIYYKVYNEVLDAVKKVAHSNGIDLVLRFNGDTVDPNDPQGILKELNKTVVFYNEAIDITPIILKEVNRGVPPATPIPKGATRPRQGVPGSKPR